eukprot:4318596-Prymnesium_polylepis.2
MGTSTRVKNKACTRGGELVHSERRARLGIVLFGAGDAVELEHSVAVKGAAVHICASPQQTEQSEWNGVVRRLGGWVGAGAVRMRWIRTKVGDEKACKVVHELVRAGVDEPQVKLGAPHGGR